MVREFVLDNNILSYLKPNYEDDEDKLPLSALESSDSTYYVVEIQKKEFTRGWDEDDFPTEIQEDIERVLDSIELPAKKIDTIRYGEAGYGMGPYGGGDSNHFDEILDRMEEVDRNSKWDALGAESAINRGMTFVTNDCDLYEAVQDYSPENIMWYSDFRNFLGFTE